MQQRYNNQNQRKIFQHLDFIFIAMYNNLYAMERESGKGTGSVLCFLGLWIDGE